MGTIYDGIPGNIAFPAAVAITSTTNANPITVTTSAPHGLLTGDKARIYDHQSNTAANGIWTVTRTGASTYTIPVAGIAAGGATGSSQGLVYGAALTLPADGDADAAATFNAALAPLTDRSAVTVLSLGQFKLARKELWLYSNLTNATWCHIAAGGVVANTAIQFVSDGVTWSTAIASVITSPTTVGIAPVFALSGVVAGDFIDVRLDTMFVADGGGGARLCLHAAIAAPGVTPTWPGGGYGEMTGGSAYAFGPAGTAPPVQVSVHGIINGAPSSGNLYIQPIYYPYNTATESPQVKGDTLLEVNIWRPTGVPQ